jgi:hypothetical protein
MSKRYYFDKVLHTCDQCDSIFATYLDNSLEYDINLVINNNHYEIYSFKDNHGMSILDFTSNNDFIFDIILNPFDSDFKEKIELLLLLR